MSARSPSDAARASAVVVRETEREVLVVRGGDRVTWLNGVVTCDVASVVEGRALFGLLLSKVGKIQTDFYVLARGEELLLACAPGTRADALRELERMLVMEDAELEADAGGLRCLSLHGPRSSELATTAARAGVTVASLDRTGLGGALLLVPDAGVGGVLSTLTDGGAVLADDEAWRTLRVERGVGVLGVDYTTADNPHEAALDRSAVSWSKGCYLGQEVVFMQDARGKLKRRLVRLAVEGPVPATGVSVLGPGGDVVGEVTSAAQSGILGSALVLGRVKAPHFEPGTRLTVGTQAAVVRAEPV
jgi:folate-binding protein YgfZ